MKGEKENIGCKKAQEMSGVRDVQTRVWRYFHPRYRSYENVIWKSKRSCRTYVI